MRVGLTSYVAAGMFALVVLGIVRGDDSPLMEWATFNGEVCEGAEMKVTGKKEEAKRPAGLLPVFRFYDHETNEHMYSLDKDELEQWRGLLHFKEHSIVGYASPVELPDTVRLWRAVHKTGRHYYYLRTTNKDDLTVDSDKFRVYVWKKPGQGRVPIYAHTWTDGGDVFFSDDTNHIRKFKEKSLKALGVNRLPLSGRDIGMPVFYAYPPSDEDKAALESESKETARKEQRKSK